MFYVYRFLDKKKNVIYVGKSKQELDRRFRGHLHLPDACYDLTYKIEYIECATESDMSIKEIYYINKFRHAGNFFNILDITDVPASVEFSDKWKQYKGPLGSHFRHSINYLKGYTAQTEVRYNKDGSVRQRKTNKKKGVSSFVEGLTSEEVDLVVDYLVYKINDSSNDNQEQLCFRNLVMFVLGVNLPLKTKDFLEIKYGDLFDEHDCPKDYTWQLGRFHKDEIIRIPLPESVKNLLVAYTKKYELTYKENSSDSLFQSRKHLVVSLISWGRIVYQSAEAVGIKKNIAAESLRKTYGLNVFERSTDKFNALLFLSELWGTSREAKIIRYLNLSSDQIDYGYYLSEYFALGNVDLAKIKCLRSYCDSPSIGR